MLCLRLGWNDLGSQEQQNGRLLALHSPRKRQSDRSLFPARSAECQCTIRLPRMAVQQHSHSPLMSIPITLIHLGTPTCLPACLPACKSALAIQRKERSRCAVTALLLEPSLSFKNCYSQPWLFWEPLTTQCSYYTPLAIRPSCLPLARQGKSLALETEFQGRGELCCEALLLEPSCRSIHRRGSTDLVRLRGQRAPLKRCVSVRNCAG
jgi:hypothetical protein